MHPPFEMVQGTVEQMGYVGALLLLTACAPSPRGTWEGTFTGDEGAEAHLELRVGARLEDTLYDFEPERWRVYEVEGEVEGWFDFAGVWMHCIDGPCIVNDTLRDERYVAEDPEEHPSVEHGAYAVLGQPPVEVMAECFPFYGHMFWPLRIVTEPAASSSTEAAGSGELGDGCTNIMDTQPGHVVLERVSRRR